jgi:Uma2 family endonuclease
MTDLATVPERWTWTVQSYEQAAEAGVFGPEPKVELLDGEVYRVVSMSPGHATARRRLGRLLARALDPHDWTVGGQDPVVVGTRSEPEPDVWVAAGPEDRYAGRHPRESDMSLVVEVANTSLMIDRNVKVPIYARGRVPEVWIVSLPERVAYVFTAPDSRAGHYERVRVIDEGGRLTAEQLGVEIALKDILPPPEPGAVNPT